MADSDSSALFRRNRNAFKRYFPNVWAGLERLRLGLTDGLDFAPRPRWPLESLAAGADAA